MTKCVNLTKSKTRKVNPEAVRKALGANTVHKVRPNSRDGLFALIDSRIRVLRERVKEDTANSSNEKELGLMAAAYETAALVTETCRVCECLVHSDRLPVCCDTCESKLEADDERNMAVVIRSRTPANARQKLDEMLAAEYDRGRAEEEKKMEEIIKQLRERRNLDPILESAVTYSPQAHARGFLLALDEIENWSKRKK